MTAPNIGDALRLLEGLRPSLVLLGVTARAELEHLVGGMRERGIVGPLMLLTRDAAARRWAEEFGRVRTSGPSTHW